MESGHHIISVSLGGPTKPSGLAVIEPRSKYWYPKGNESELGFENHFDVVWLQRFPAGEAYPYIVSAVREVASQRRLARDSTLLVDITNTGTAPLGLFDNQGLYPETFRVTDTGQSARQTDGTQVLASSDMISAGHVALQTDRLHAAKTLDLASSVITDLQAFDPDASDKGRPVDLVFAVAMAVWWGETMVWSDEVAASMLPEDDDFVSPGSQGRSMTTGY